MLIIITLRTCARILHNIVNQRNGETASEHEIPTTIKEAGGGVEKGRNMIEGVTNVRGEGVCQGKAGIGVQYGTMVSEMMKTKSGGLR